MYKFLALLALASCFACISFAASFNKNINVEAFFDSLLGTEKLLQEKKISNIVISIVHDKSLIFSKGYGYGNPGSRTDPVSPSTTLYPIASVSKTFTGIAAMQLVKNGAISFTENVNNYLQASAIAKGRKLVGNTILGDAIGNSVNGGPTSMAKSPISMFNLLTHTAGFDERFQGTSVTTAEEKKSLVDYLYSDLPPRIYPANQMIYYSNHGFLLAGLVVQETAKQEFGAYLNEKIFKPLGMNNTYFVNPPANAMIAKPMVLDSTKYVSVRTEATPLSYVGAAGGIFSTADDLAKYGIMLLNNGGQVLDSDSFDQMFNKDQFTVKQGMDGIGLVWFRKQHDVTVQVHHSGSLSPYFSKLSVFPETKVSLFMSMVGVNSGILDTITNQFMIRTMTNNLTYCSAPNQLLKDGTECLEFTRLSDIKGASSDSNERFNTYAQCYRMARYEHTTWYKYFSMFSPAVCLTNVQGKYLQSTEPVTNIVLYETDTPNLFRMGNIVETLGSEERVAYSLTGNGKVSFMVKPEFSLTSAAFLLIDNTPFEHADGTNSARRMFIASLVLLIIMCCCGCCIGTLCWCGNDLRFCIVTAFRANQGSKYTVNAANIMAANTAEFSNAEQLLTPEEKPATEYYFNAAAQAKTSKLETARKVVMVVSFVLTVITLILMLLSIICAVLHFRAVSVAISSIALNPNDSLCFSALTRGSSLKFYLDLTVLSVVSISFMSLACIIAVITRCIGLRHWDGHILTAMLPILTIPVFVLVILYFVAATYFNIGGSQYLV